MPKKLSPRMSDLKKRSDHTRDDMRSAGVEAVHRGELLGTLAKGDRIKCGEYGPRRSDYKFGKR